MKKSLSMLLVIVLILLALGQVSTNQVQANSKLQTTTVNLTLATGVDEIQWSDIAGMSGIAVPTWIHYDWTSLVGANWVWNEYLEDTPVEGNIVTFTQVFALPTDATSIQGNIQIAADNFLTLFLNNQVVAPISAGVEYKQIYSFSLAEFLQPGNNELRAVVENVPFPGANAYINPGGILYRADISYESSAPSLPDLYIDSIGPIQVVESADFNSDGKVDLVLGKPMVIRVNIEVLNSQLLPADQLVDIDLLFEGNTLHQTRTIEEIVSGPIDFYVVPNMLGDNPIVAVIDPNNQLAEENEGNNRITPDPIVVIKDTQPLSIVYLNVPFPSQLSTYQEMIDRGSEFLDAIYPLNPNEISRTISNKPVSVAGASGLPDKVGFRTLYLNLYLIGKTVDKNADKIVAVVPDDFPFYYLQKNSAGLAVKSNNSTVVFVVDGYWLAEAHEISHTFGLDDNLNKPASNGFWVVKNEQKINQYDFMGYSPSKRSFDGWIAKDNYEFLFNRLKINKTDPSILLVTGSISPDGSVEFYKLLRLPEGTISETEGNYDLQLLDIDGNIINSVKFDASPYVYDSDVMLDKSPFAFAVEYSDSAVILQVSENGTVLGRTNLLTKLLRDAIGAIPDAGFTNNPNQLRQALFNKVSELEKKINTGDITGALNKLQYDIKHFLNLWLKNDYPVTDHLQLSKTEIMTLVDFEVTELLGMK